MSTQEREAMERLVEIGNVSITPELFKDWIDARNVVVAAALSRHARSLQPITVEGLVAMGWVKFDDWIGTYDYPSILGLKRSGCEFYYGKEKVFPRPLSLADVDNLIERLSR